MPDAFISYSIADEEIAQFMYKHLMADGISTFLASVSIQAGTNWSDEILSNLKYSDWVFFLASKRACESPFVQQELGGALIAGKTIVPIIWEIAPSELPGWVKKDQAINLAGVTIEDAKIKISEVASRIKSKKLVGGLVVAAFITALIVLSKK